MVRTSLRIAAFALCLTIVPFASSMTAQAPAGDAKALEGLWTGAWGGGARGGVVFQPVIVELFVRGDQVELAGFRNVGRLAGTVQVDANAKRLRITPAAGGQAATRAIEYVYDLQGDKLTLTDGDQLAIAMQRLRLAQNPLAQVPIELVAASGISAAGELQVTEFVELRAGPASLHRPEPRLLSTTKATILVVQETGVKQVTLEEARRLIREATAVAVAYRQDERPAADQLHVLWKDLGSPAPDGEAVGRTLARTLRPGTLVFVLSARENVSKP